MGFQQLTVSHSDKPRRRAPQACRTARSAGWARGKGAGSHPSSVLRAGEAAAASAAGNQFPPMPTTERHRTELKATECLFVAKNSPKTRQVRGLLARYAIAQARFLPALLQAVGKGTSHIHGSSPSQRILLLGSARQPNPTPNTCKTANGR